MAAAVLVSINFSWTLIMLNPYPVNISYLNWTQFQTAEIVSGHNFIEFIENIHIFIHFSRVCNKLMQFFYIWTFNHFTRYIPSKLKRVLLLDKDFNTTIINSNSECNNVNDFCLFISNTKLKEEEPTSKNVSNFWASIWKRLQILRRSKIRIVK